MADAMMLETLACFLHGLVLSISRNANDVGTV